MDYLKRSTMDYLSSKPTSLDYLNAYATMLDRTRLYFQGLPQMRETVASAHHLMPGRERGEIPLDLSMKTIRQTPDSTNDDDVIVLEHKKAAARAHALSKLHADAARHRFGEHFSLPPGGATFQHQASGGKKCQHGNANLGLLPMYGGETLVPAQLAPTHLGLLPCDAPATCVEFPRCRELMAPGALAIHPALHRTQMTLGGVHPLSATYEQQRNAMAKLIPLCPSQNNAPLPQDMAALAEMHRLGLNAGFLVPPTCMTMPMNATAKLSGERYPMFPKENACPCCPPTGLPIPCACCVPKQTQRGSFTAAYPDACCPPKDLPFGPHVQQTLYPQNGSLQTVKGSSSYREKPKKEMRHVKSNTIPTPPLVPSTPPTPASPDGCARTDGRDKRSMILKDAERCRLDAASLSTSTLTRVYAPLASIPPAQLKDSRTDAAVEATTPKDAPLPSGVPSGETLSLASSPSPAKAEEAAAARRKNATTTVWRPGGNWDEDDEAAIPKTLQDKAAPPVENSKVSFVEELVKKYRKRYVENRALQRLLLSIRRPKPPTGAMLPYLVPSRNRQRNDGRNAASITNEQPGDDDAMETDVTCRVGNSGKRRSKDKRLAGIWKRRIQKIIIKAETVKTEKEKLDKVEKLIVRLYYGRRKLLGDRKRRSRLSELGKSKIKRRKTTFDAEEQQVVEKEDKTEISNIKGNSVSKCPAPFEMKRLMINKTLGETVLHRAARQGYTEVVLYCLETKYVDIDSKDNAGYTPLHECCSRGHLKIARYLLQYGADVNASAAGGIRPIHDAVENDHVEVTRLLLSYGADPLLATYSGLTPLKIAHSANMLALLKGFLADVTGESNEPVMPWTFQGAARCHDPVENGYDIFEDMPSDAEDNCDDITFEISCRPHIQTYLLNPVGNLSSSGPEFYSVLEEVLCQTGQSREQFLEMHSGAHIISLSPKEFSQTIELSQVTNQTLVNRFGNVSSVHLVKMDEVVRHMLGLETVVISSLD